ncbi:MAG TPA: dTDP-4-amino-4,6-dideoxygalactose transaminase [Spirochaetota bacterium]|nr:dTDP-4-amino-4,6-dideoxygalactose transaminase [Spirochaetota bacterium]
MDTHNIFIPFNKPPHTGNEEQYIKQALQSGKISGDGKFGNMCEQWFQSQLQCKRTLLTSSCTHALEMCAMLIDTKPGDEIIMPSYTFVSTANAFVLRGATIVFVDIRPDTMNIDETKIEKAITTKTKAIVVVHYAGVACAMDAIRNIAMKYNIPVIEDAAQAMLSTYNGSHAGTLGQLGTFSFHESKNYTSAGEGGLLLVNHEQWIQRSEIIREKGTNRSQFFRGMVDKYTWVDIGSSYLMNDVSAAYLWGQLEKADDIFHNRMKTWNMYYESLLPLNTKGIIALPIVPDECRHNAHMFYIKVDDLHVRTQLLKYLKNNGIYAVFHYVPLHSSPAGQQYGRFDGTDEYTTKESERLLRLPLYYGMPEQHCKKVIDTIYQFFS